MHPPASRYSHLLALARTGSITSAAALLGVTASAVSQQVTRLERDEGIALVERGPRGFVLTPAGRILAASAERIEAELADARRRLAEVAGGVSGDVTFGAFQTAIRGVLVPLLLRLPALHPGIRLRIIEGDDAQLDRWLRSGDIDIAVLEHDAQAGAEPPPGMHDTPLLDDPWRVVLPAGSTAPSALRDLAEETWLGAQPGGASARALARLEATSGMSLHTDHEYFEFSVALALVAAKQGIALLPTLALIPPIPEGVTVTVLPGAGHRRLSMRVRDQRRSGAIAAIMESAVATAATELARIEDAMRLYAPLATRSVTG